MNVSPTEITKTQLASPEQALRQLFDNSLEGWPLDGVVIWLLTQGRLIEDSARFVGAVCERLVEAGAPLSRIRIGMHTLNPQVKALSYLWERGKKVEIARIPHGIENSSQFIGSPMQQVLRGLAFRRRLDDLVEGRDHLALHEIKALGGTDYFALPVRCGDEVSGAVNFSTDRTEGFVDDDLTKLTILTELLSPVLETMAMNNVARSLLDTYLGHRTGERVLKGRIQRGDGETIDAAMWFSDLRDFTSMTETLSLPDLLDTLNLYFELVAAAVTARDGEILRFIGDAMLIVFPTSVTGGARAACAAALDAAVDAFDSLATVNHRRKRAGMPLIKFGVGLHSGTVMYGNVGAPDRLDFTVMGPAVNRTARLESLTKKVNCPLLMSQEFAGLIDTAVHSLGKHEMKGVATTQEVFALSD